MFKCQKTKKSQQKRMFFKNGVTNFFKEASNVHS